MKAECTHQDCKQLQHSRGLCKKHYGIAWRAGTLNQPQADASNEALAVPALAPKVDDLVSLRTNLEARAKAARLATFTTPLIGNGWFDDEVAELIQGILTEHWGPRTQQLATLALSPTTTAADVERVLIGSGL